MPAAKKPFTVTARPRPTTEAAPIRFGDDLDLLTSPTDDADTPHDHTGADEQESISAVTLNSSIAKKQKSKKETHPTWPTSGLKRCPTCDRAMKTLAIEQDSHDYVLYHQAITEFLERQGRLPQTHT